MSLYLLNIFYMLSTDIDWTIVLQSMANILSDTTAQHRSEPPSIAFAVRILQPYSDDCFEKRTVPNSTPIAISIYELLLSSSDRCAVNRIRIRGILWYAGH